MKIENNTLYDVTNEDIEDGTFIIPDGVTSIGDWAFYGCRGLTNIAIPNSVKSIGDWAFVECNALPSITIPDSVTSIGKHTFHKCSSLPSIVIPNSVTSIGDYAFYKCSGLTDMTIGNGMTSIGQQAFFGCRGLTSITIPNSVKSIGNNAFYRCTDLTTKKSIYKAFDLTSSNKIKCKDKVYTPNKWNMVRGDLELCKNGIHYCTNLFEIFNYYSGELDKSIAIYECEIKGEDLTEDDSSKHCCRWLKPVKRLSREEIINILNGKGE